MRFASIREMLQKLLPGAAISVGFASLRSGVTLDELMAEADAQMYARRSARRAMGE